MEAEPQRLDLRSIAGTGGDDRLMTARLQTEAYRHIRMQVAQRAERREDDPHWSSVTWHWSFVVSQ
jgi:hypothetical protein